MNIFHINNPQINPPPNKIGGYTSGQLFFSGLPNLNIYPARAVA
jgi:hypothetical protein